MKAKLVMVIILTLLFLVIQKRKIKPQVGYTHFKPTGVRHDYPYIDLEKRQVIGTVSYKGKIHMTVKVDIGEDTVQVKGDVTKLGQKGMDRESYIDMFRNQATFFIENNISNPKEYYRNIKDD